ncbi:trypsin-like serine peptidase [Kitasatospora sp. NPDC088346]|uniref:trypsin-like serine peptidase n=1 Tax=Kitasatospora sp. NPDC088346 TaxID=3364073 RepID=UPI00381ADD71
MSSILRRSGAAALVTLLALAAAGCADDTGPRAAPPPVPAAAATAAGKNGIKLPDALKDLKNWSADDLANWAAAHGFKPELLKGYWNQVKMEAAKGLKPKDANITSAKSPSRSEVQLPSAVAAVAEKHPYNSATAVVGKIFLSVSPTSDAECSGTVVSDPVNPGRSNLVWTAAHCVHQGQGGDWFKRIGFVPSYNRAGAASGGRPATVEQLAPYGAWTMDDGYIDPHWYQEGSDRGGPASQFDFAVIHVHNEDGSGRSLEETVGGSIPIWFNAPADQITAASAYGYPADTPFDGLELEHCDTRARLTPYVYDAERPPMNAMGCTMTGGSSGGGWFAQRGGKPVLISNTSVGNDAGTFLAGPTLGADALKGFDYFSRKKH